MTIDRPLFAALHEDVYLGISICFICATIVRQLSHVNFHTYYLSSAICVWRNLVFQILGRSHQWSLYLRLLGKGLQLKTIARLVFFLELVVSEKLVNNSLFDHLGKYTFFISSMVLCLLNQLQIFWQLYLIELLRLSTGLGLLK